MSSFPLLTGDLKLDVGNGNSAGVRTWEILKHTLIYLNYSGTHLHPDRSDVGLRGQSLSLAFIKITVNPRFSH